MLLKPVYYEFLLTKHCFCHNPEENIDIKKMGALGVCRQLIYAYRMVKTGCEKFEFHKIISEPTPAPRFNNSTTNILELMAWIMKSNGSRWSTVPQFVRQCIHLYNFQIRQMIDDYDRYTNCALTSIGYSIIYSHTIEYHKIPLPSFKLVDHASEHDLTQWCTSLSGTFTMDNKGADTHRAVLSWRHQNPDEESATTILYPFTFTCEIHVHLCDSMKCPCICFNYLFEHYWKNKFESTYQYLPLHVQAEMKENPQFCQKLYHPVFNTENGRRIIND